MLNTHPSVRYYSHGTNFVKEHFVKEHDNI